MSTMRPDDHVPHDEATEERLRAALRASATTRVPVDRPAPPLDLPATTGRGPGRLVAVGAAAAAVAAIAVGVAVAGDRSERTLPATPSPTPTASVPTPSASVPTTPPPSASPTSSATSSPTSSAPPTRVATDPPGPVRTTIGTASLVVPDGYRLREDRGDGTGGPIGRRWCLDTDGTSDCVVAVEEMDPEANLLDSDVEGGYASNPQLCRDEGFPETHDLLEYRDVEVGGRAGEYRRWRWGCHDGTAVDVAQVTVVTPDAWTVSTERASSTVRRVLDELVSSLELPAATSSVRLYDHGVLRSVEDVGDSRVRLEVDRVVTGRPNSNPATYSYLAPRDLRADGRPLAELVDATVTLWTDGRLVTQVVG